MNHYARVWNKRRIPRSSPKKPSFSVKRPQSPRNNQFRHQNGSNINKIELEFDQMTVIQNLQEQPKNLTHLSTTIQQYIRPSTSIFHIKKRSKHAPNLSKDDANSNNRDLLTQ